MIRVESSFRDPDGFVFYDKNEIYRAVNTSYQKSYDHLLKSGLYQKLVERELMVRFTEVEQTELNLSGYYKVLKPERITFISYPYEWAFSMVKDAALLTLEIQKIALEHGMSLKDASAFNVQFQNGKPIFIDTLSFEIYREDSPWIAYRQFCQHFVATLALMSKVDPLLNRMFIFNIDGIPLELAAKMLPMRSRFNIYLYLHIFLHAKSQKKNKDLYKKVTTKKRKFSSWAMKSLIEGLITTIKNQHWDPKGTEWADYTAEGVHIPEYTLFKTKLISEWIFKIKPSTVWDLGSNSGYYSRLAAKAGARVIAYDVDPACVNKNYTMVRDNNETNILPLVMDLLNPSPSIGWAGSERSSVYQRNKPDLILALAIIHHLVISFNIPLDSIAQLFAKIADHLIIEFVPINDDKIQLMLLNRDDQFPDYTQCKFEEVFSKHYHIEQCLTSDCNHRIFYLLRLK